MASSTPTAAAPLTAVEGPGRGNGPEPVAEASRKRLHCGEADDGEPDTKRARPDGRSDAVMFVAVDPSSAEEFIGGLDDSAVEAVSDAVTARQEKIQRAVDEQKEMASPFNPSCTAFSQFGPTFCEYVLPHVSAEDACALRLQSRAVRDWVDLNGRVSLKQLLHAIKSRNTCHQALQLQKRFLAYTDNTFDIYTILVAAATRTVDADTSADIIESLLSRVVTPVGGMSQFFALWYALNPRASERTLGWSDVCVGVPVNVIEENTRNSDSDDYESDAAPDDYESDAAPDDYESDTECEGHSNKQVVKQLGGEDVDIQSYYAQLLTAGYSTKAKYFEDDESVRQYSVFKLLVLNMSRGNTRVSPRLFEVLFGRRIISKADAIREADKLVSDLICSMAIAEEAGLPIAKDVAALEYLLEVLDDCCAREIDFTLSTDEITKRKISAPLIDILRIPIVTRKRSAGPLTLAAKRNNPTALRYIARRALAQGVSTKAQSRVVALAVREGHFDCVRVLCEEFFTTAPNTFVKLMVDNRLPWSTEAQKRGEAFAAIISDVGMCIARGSLNSMIKSLDTAMALKIYPKISENRFWHKLPKVKSDAWGTTIAGDFLSALWRSTSGDPRLRNAVTNMAPFRAMVNRAIIAHLSCKFKAATVGTLRSEEQKREFCAGDGMAALLSRIAELFDMQRRVDWCIDLEAGNVGSLNPAQDGPNLPVYVPTLGGAVFDRWLRRLIIMVSASGWCYVDAAANATQEIAGIVMADTVHTDNTFCTVARMAGSASTPSPSPQWTAELLYRACAPRRGTVTKIDLARRLLRWCGWLGVVISSDEKEAASKGSADSKSQVLPKFGCALSTLFGCLTDFVASTKTNAIRLSDVLAHVDKFYATDPVVHSNVAQAKGKMSEMRTVLKGIITDKHGEELGGVEVLYDTYGGDFRAALTDLTKDKMAGPVVPEPKGAVRDIVVYMMSSPVREIREEFMDVIMKTVAHYTEGVTLPCTWEVRGGVTSTRNMSRWLRDLMRGRKPHTVWWKNG